MLPTCLNAYMLKQLKEQISAFVSLISLLPKFKPSSVTVQTGFRDLVGNPEDCFFLHCGSSGDELCGLFIREVHVSVRENLMCMVSRGKRNNCASA